MNYLEKTFNNVDSLQPGGVEAKIPDMNRTAYHGSWVPKENRWELYTPLSVSPWGEAVRADLAKTQWSGRHMAKPGATVIPAAPIGEEVLAPAHPDILFRGGTPQGQNIYTSAHPDVAAAYSVGNTAPIAPTRKGADRKLFAYRRPTEGIVREQPADLVRPNQEVTPGDLEWARDYREQTKAKMIELGNKRHVPHFMENYGIHTPTYETIIKSPEHLGAPLGQYSVTPVRTSTGYGYQLTDAAGMPAKELFGK